MHVFISKPVDENSKLKAFCKKRNFSLEATSLLTFQAVPFQAPTNFDLIFFGSPRAARFYLQKEKVPANVRIATAGIRTKDVVEQHNYSAHFIPSQSGEIVKSAQEFADFVGNKKVFFPISNRSNLSYASGLEKKQIHTTVVYQTQLAPKKVKDKDVYIFTSPSNVEAFFLKNKLKEPAQIIAWGTSTEKELKNRGIQHIQTLTFASEEEVVTLLQ